MPTPPDRLRGQLTGYRYNGPHRHFDRVQRRMVPSHDHWDWRYAIKLGDITVLQRQSFCTWQGAFDSMETAMLRLNAVLDQAHAMQATERDTP
jgi:hypothetical protein